MTIKRFSIYRTKGWFLLFVGIFCFAVHLPARSADHTYPPSVSLEQLKDHISKAPKSHPRLFLNGDDLSILKKRIKSDSFAQSIADCVIAQADRLLDVPPVTRTLQGRRLLGQSRRCIQHITTLSMAYLLTGDDKYVRRCEKEMLDVSAFTDWNPSHFLDVAEMTMALAIGYDWLYNQLDEESRKTIREAIVQKGVILPFETSHKGWVKSQNNWGQVCHGGLTAGALAVLEYEPDLAARTVHNALQNVTHSMAAFAPNGNYPEGPGYWSYGTTYNVLLIDAIEGVLGTDYGLSLAPGFDRTGQYLNVVCGPSGLTFNYADGGAGRSAEPAIFWFADTYKRPDWLRQEYDLFENTIERAKASKSGTYGSRFLSLTLLWLGDAEKNAPVQMPLNWYGQGHVPITIHRSSWTDENAVFVGLKAGSPSANHGQMDTGSFVLDADGVRWALDLGAEGYHGIESRGMDLWDRSQDSDRWTIFRQQNYGHNTLVIDDQLQIVKNAGEIIKFSDNKNNPFSVVDLSPVYEGQAATVQRGIMLLPSNEVLIQDELSGLKPGSRVRWGMITPAEPGKTGNAQIELHQKGKTLTLQSLASNKAAKWQIINTENPRHEWDSKNQGTCMAALVETVPSDGKLTLSVLITPDSCKKSLADTLELKPLQNWK